jgi:hypothetical protein
LSTFFFKLGVSVLISCIADEDEGEDEDEDEGL